MTWHWPQITWAILVGLHVIISLARDGEPKRGEHHALTDLVAIALGVWILYMGGFWTHG